MQTANEHRVTPAMSLVFSIEQYRPSMNEITLYVPQTKCRSAKTIEDINGTRWQQGEDPRGVFDNMFFPSLFGRDTNRPFGLRRRSNHNIVVEL